MLAAYSEGGSWMTLIDKFLLGSLGLAGCCDRERKTRWHRNTMNSAGDRPWQGQGRGLRGTSLHWENEHDAKCSTSWKRWTCSISFFYLCKVFWTSWDNTSPDGNKCHPPAFQSKNIIQNPTIVCSAKRIKKRIPLGRMALGGLTPWPSKMMSSLMLSANRAEPGWQRWWKSWTKTFEIVWNR